MSTPLRVSAISFLNTVPLMYGFEYPPLRDELRSRFDVHYTLPAQCADELRAGTSDIGIIPVAAFTEIPHLWIIPGVSIASKRQVRSILLVSKRDLRDVRSVATDNSSRTSVALLKVLFRNRFGASPEYVPTAPDLRRMLAKHDAALLIGDPALQIDITKSRYQIFDLAEEWNAMTGLPFVFAFWAVLESARHQALESSTVDAFQKSRDAGMQNVRGIANRSALKYGVSPELALEYLTRHIDYSLDTENLAGLKSFFHLAQTVGALTEAPPIRFLY
ncbi:MAG: menaquinone biosynthesis protein [Acidobacteriales bacterium]|nr:menaquinone biosynthesis protein [Terriglobales bacterium]